MANHFSITLTDSYMLAPEVRHLVFKRTDGAELAYIPGQFLQIHFEHQGAPTKRSYSIANAPVAGDGSIEIAVSYVQGGAATALLSALQHGQELTASGPYGRFCLMDADQNQRYILIGTGTGITPYRAMLPKAVQLMSEKNLKFALVQGARSKAELLYHAEFLAFANAHPNFSYWPYTSREDADQNAGTRRGHVQSALTDLQLDPSQDLSYLCGNPNMVDECFNLLKEKAFPVPAVRREKYISSK
jgi:ferredoxin-NADP reductase